jgi:hypothetical protein
MGDKRGVVCLGVLTLTERRDSLVLTVFISAVLSALLIIGGNEQNPGSVMEVETPCDSYVSGAAGIYIREFSVNCVNGGIAIVVET